MIKSIYFKTKYVDNKFCAAIINKCEVFCKCGQKVILDNDYDVKRLNKHSRNLRLREYLEYSLPPPPPSFSNKPCPGFHSEQIVTYINQTPATYC
ncbi:hypothetical protein GLOIN_2v1767203 [Rhizophagus irregularis DAOM 181602=DAOM 197198]|nr:hypothetical protein GLOIN_2v1767203 [Rhizophagus irregularis DAOM 181602=DAOM 197198]